MIVIIKGDEELFIEQKLNEYLKQDAEIYKYDGNLKSFNLDEMLNSLNTESLFYNKKIICIKNPPFLINKTNDKEIEKILNYINNPNDDCDFIIYSFDNAFNEKLKIYKDITKKAKVISCNSFQAKEFINYANDRINSFNLKLDYKAKSLLIEYANNNASLLEKNIEILSLYPEEINVDVVEALCNQSEELNIFDLINAITNKHISKAIYLTRKIIKNNNSILPLISLLSGQLRYLYYISYLNSKKYDLYQIIDITNSKEFRIKSALNTLKNLTMKEILSFLNKLSDIDYSIKTNVNFNEIYLFEFYILNMLRNDKEG